MDFNATVDLILKDLNEARDIIDDLKNYPGVPVLQVELAKSKCKSACEVIALLKTIRHEEVHPKREIPQSPSVSKKEEPARTPKKPAKSTVIADTFDLTGRINEQLGGLRDDDNVSELIKTTPLMNLDDAIGVNDKFLFIREIFSGSPESYDQAISKLNNAANFSEARAVLLDYTGDEKETEVVRQLLKLIKRKFPADE
jgi:hypothetical protein